MQIVNSMVSKSIFIKFLRKPEFGYYLGIIRTLIASSSILIFLFTDLDKLFYNNIDIVVNPDFKTVKYGITTQYSLFNLLEIDIAAMLCLIILLLVISGYFMKISSILHFYVAYSFFNSSALINGANQIALILTLLLIPICFFEDRKNHWSSEKSKKTNFYTAISLNFILLFARIQISYIYFQAFYKKLGLEDWVNGTALWNYFQDSSPYSVDTGLRRSILDFIIYNNKTLVLITWSILLIEFLLSLTLFIKQKNRIYLFVLGFLLHCGIAFFMGLYPFALVMISALLLLTFPLNYKNLNTIYHKSIKRKLGIT
jgi:antimicrobial peptide system SdpB family protein